MYIAITLCSAIFRLYWPLNAGYLTAVDVSILNFFGGMPVLFGCYTILLKKQQDTRYRPRKILLKKGKLFFTFFKDHSQGPG